MVKIPLSNKYNYGVVKREMTSEEREIAKNLDKVVENIVKKSNIDENHFYYLREEAEVAELMHQVVGAEKY